MNLHTIQVKHSRRFIARRLGPNEWNEHYRETYDSSDMEVRGRLEEVWIEDGKPFGLWKDRDTEEEWIIFVYEYNNNEDIRTITSSDDHGLERHSWYLDYEHVIQP